VLLHYSVSANVQSKTEKKKFKSYGQLYVFVSRVTSREGLKILITDEDSENADETSNVVYEKVFRNV
jgi:hypothetical protein